jgi:hypothetical protein
VHDAVNVLRRRLVALRTELATVSAGHALPEYQMLEADYWRQLLQAEIAWVQTLLDRLVAGTIEWPSHVTAGGGA